MGGLGLLEMGLNPILCSMGRLAATAARVEYLLCLPRAMHVEAGTKEAGPL